MTKLNDSPATFYLQLIELVLVSNTTTQAHELRRDDAGSFVLISRSNLHDLLRPSSGKQDGKEMEIDPTFWNQTPLPNTIAPTFETCNIQRSYFLDIKIGLLWGIGKAVYVSRSRSILYAFHHDHTSPSSHHSSPFCAILICRIGIEQKGKLALIT